MRKILCVCSLVGILGALQLEEARGSLILPPEDLTLLCQLVRRIEEEKLAVKSLWGFKI